MTGVLLPLFALVVGIIALFTNTSNHKTRKAIIIGLIVFQVSAFVLTIVDNIEKQSENNKLSQKIDYLVSDVRSRKLGNEPSAINLEPKTSSATAAPAVAAIAGAPAATEADIPYPIQTSGPTSKPAISSSGAVYYGWQADDGEWLERFFTNTSSRQIDSFPQVGDIIEAAAMVNLREDYAEKVDGRWVNAPSKDIIQPNMQLRVVEVNDILDSFVWVKVEFVQ